MRTRSWTSRLATRIRALALLAALPAAGAAARAEAAPPPAPTGLSVVDVPLDEGGVVAVKWTAGPGSDAASVASFKILRSLAPSEKAARRRDMRVAAARAAMDAEKEALLAKGVPEAEATAKAKEAAQKAAQAAATAPLPEFILAKSVPFDPNAPAGVHTVDLSRLPVDGDYRWRVEAAAPDGSRAGETLAGTVGASRGAFLQKKLALAIWVATICGVVVAFIVMARSGRPMRIRRIAALEAVDEAVGRATEMGRPVLFIPGVQDMDNVQTVAGITILSRVARTAAEYDAALEVPTSRSLVMQASREAVQTSYMEVGRSDSFNADNINYITDEQFGYVAYVGGRMVRAKPSACFYMGCFFAESLILAETGNSIGAIQIAGTAETSQLPFFVAACDYTLIGEEFFAASAYLSGQPDQIGSVKAQDVGKALAMVVALLVALAATLLSLDVGGAATFVDFMREATNS